MGRKGLHNTLEPAYFSKPIIIGKNYDRFEEAKAMIKKGGMVSVKDYDEFHNNLERIISDEVEINRTSKINFDYFNKQKGAVKIILNQILKLKN